MKIWKKSVAFLLALALTLLCLPLASFAANDEDVVSYVEYNGVQYKPDKDKNIQVDVPNSFGEKALFDLNGLTFVSKDSVKIFGTNFLPNSTITAAKNDVRSVDVHYKNVSGDTSTVFKSTYTISLRLAEYIAPTFSGSDIQVRTAVSGSEYVFSPKDITDCYTQNDGKALGFVRISGGKPSVAQVKVGNGVLKTTDGLGATVAAKDFGNIKIKALTTGAFTLILSAIQSDTAQTPVEGSVIVDVKTFKTMEIPEVTAKVDQVNTLDIPAGEIGSAFKLTAGSDLKAIKFTSTPSYGKLVLDYVNDSQYGEVIKSGSTLTTAQLAKLKYMPSRIGTESQRETLTYVGLDFEGSEFTGTVKITINNGLDLEDLTARLKPGSTLRMNSLDFAGKYKGKGFGTFDHIQFYLPDSVSGELRYNYKNESSRGTAVDSTTDFYLSGTNRDLLSNLYFVPKRESSGTFSIIYNAYDSNNSNRAMGRIRISVGAGIIESFKLSVEQGNVLGFSGVGNSINTRFRNAVGEDFKYVKFTLPVNNRGTLYYKYDRNSSSNTNVSTNTAYYRGGSSNLIDSIVFVPAPGYTGTFTLDYSAYDSFDNEYKGQFDISVTPSDFELATISYSVDANKVFDLSSDDISKKVYDRCKDDFDYVCFDVLPSSSSVAKLYYNYKSSTSYDLQLQAGSTKYYRTNDSKIVNNISVVPYAGYTGTFDIEYTAYVTNREYYTGKITVKVNPVSAKLETVSVKTAKNTNYTFKASDFTTAFGKATSITMNYITFNELPLTTNGVLYYKYESASKPGTKVVKMDEFFRAGTSGLISQLTFVPVANYEGTVKLAYTAYDINDTGYKGTVEIVVGSGNAPAKTELSFKDVPSGKYYCDAVKWAVDRKVAYGTSDTTFSPDASCNRAQAITFIWRAAGSPKPTSTSTKFTDVKKDDYYYDAVLWAVEKKIASGVSTTKFGPSEKVSRAQIVTFLWRWAGSPTYREHDGFVDVKSSDYYLMSVRWAKFNNITGGTSEKYFSPKKDCTRAEIVTFLYRNDKL